MHRGVKFESGVTWTPISWMVVAYLGYTRSLALKVHVRYAVSDGSSRATEGVQRKGC